MLLPVMLQLPIVHGAKRQRQAGCLAKHLLVTAEQFRTSQGVNELPVLLGAVSGMLRRANGGRVQSRTALVGNFIAKSVPRSPKNRDGSAAYIVLVESEHVFAGTLQTFYHYPTHPLEKIVA